ncbi:MAG: hypothetical protein EGP82_00285 [Odoribacter splanchnicus]|nr:hypothetical protein [Odoribacter splanchnicus]
MYNYPDKIEISTASIVEDGEEENGNIKYDENGDPIFPGTGEGGEPGEQTFELLSDCRIEENNSYTISGTYVYSFNVYIPKTLDPAKLPVKGNIIRLTKKDKTVNGVVATVVDSRSTKFNYVVKT